MSKAENKIIGIVGNKGEGKTTVLTLFAYSVFEDKTKEYIFSNYEFAFTFNWLNAYELILNWQKFSNSLVCIDELHDYADSRNSSSIQNRLICSWFLQSRHTETDICFSTQFPDQVDKRIMRIVDIEILCENLHIDIDNDGNNDMFRLTIVNNNNRTVTQRNVYLAPVFEMFDSKSKINPFFISKNKQNELLEKLSSLNDDKFKEIDYTDIKTLKRNI